MMNFKERLSASQAKMNEVKAKMNDAAETAQIAGMLAKDELDARIETLKGDINANSENARLAAERSKGKFNSALLKAQMTVESAKQAIADAKEAHDKAQQEARISDLLDYADQCETLAMMLIAESNLALLEAAAEVVKYDEKYNQ